MILGPSGQNLCPEEIYAKSKNMPFVQESLVVEQNQKLVALIFTDIDSAEVDGHSNENLERIMEKNRIEVNKNILQYCQMVKVKLYPEAFEKTSKRSIMRFLYQFSQS